MRQNKYSDLKIAWFPEKLASFRDGKIAAPIYVRVKPHNSCSHGCHWCVYSTGFREHDAPGHLVSHMHEDMRETDSIPSEKMFEVLEDFRAMGVRAVTYTGGGEPLQHPDIIAFAERTLDYGIDLSLITNGQMLQKRRGAVFGNAKWVRVSMDYQNGEQIHHSRNIPPQCFDIIMRNIEEFAKLKSPTCDLGVNYIVTKDNYVGLADFIGVLKDAGVENVRVSPVWTPDFLAYHRPIEEKVKEEIELAKELNDDSFSVYSSYDLESPAHSPVRNHHKCFFMQMVPVVGADQLIYACHNKAYDATGVIGSIKNQRFKDLWYSDEAKRVFDGLDAMVVCKHQCANHAKNDVIYQLLESAEDAFV